MKGTNLGEFEELVLLAIDARSAVGQDTVTCLEKV
jgi:hypothetical protein